MSLSIIVANDENGLIGQDNALPWHLPADLKYFKYMSIGKNIIMGKNTYNSIGGALPNRVNIVISRTETSFDGAVCYKSLEEAIKDYPEAMLIGGAQLYTYAIEKGLVDVVYLTKIHHSFGEGDAYFNPNLNDWKVESEIFNAKDEKNIYDYSYLKYVRK